MNKERILRVSVITTLILLILYFYPKYDILTNLTIKILAISSSLYFGIVPIYYGNTIFLNFGNITPLVVSPECSGIFLIFVFLLVVWFVPNIDIKNRLYAFMLVPIIISSNIIRLLVAIIIGDKFNTDVLRLYHGTIGQLFIFVVLIGCFIIFINYSKENENKISSS